MSLTRRIGGSIAAAFLLCLVSPAANAGPDCGGRPLIVFAAASLTDAANDMAAAFEEETGCTVSVSIAGSSTLARQVAEGAPAGVFLSANRQWVDWLQEEAPDRVIGDPVVIARNSLVAVSSKAPAKDAGLAAILSPHFAMGDPAHVPAGIYGKAALETLGVWAEIEKNGVFTENVRVALQLAARGEVGAAIVYATDAKMEPDLAIAWRFDPETHPEIAYEGVVIDGSEPGAAFLDLVDSRQGREILSRYGFMPGKAAGNG